METIKIAVLAVGGLIALVVVVRAGYSFRAEGHGLKIEVMPPRDQRPPPRGDQKP